MFQKVGKSQNKVALAEEIGCIKKVKKGLVLIDFSALLKKYNPGKVDGCVGGWMGVKDILRIAYSNTK